MDDNLDEKSLIKLDILVSFSDVSRLAVNGFPVNDSVYILDPEFEYIGKQYNF
ncbi:hypothetical protein QJR30_09300 [Paraclostridium sordellii]|uniref:hypothetical protein n=1 Tax=Paraclostridium sordellii TaxID=1505 RepID=UPI0005DACCE8|nr:hypothetical protein [Paeniclostridium sordellii]CEP80672.1 Uncharacterised protein [[Clostridium] sordellii] [Paeniclostridium sordellii]